MDAIIVFCALSFLLVVGKAFRVRLPILQRLYLPASVIGGVVGLVAVTALGARLSPEIVRTASKCPGFLINVIFATIFLGAATPKFRDIVTLALPQLVLGQMLAWGQYVIGLGLAGFVFVKLFGVPAAFGNLLEIGFEGGHGTVGGMTEAFVAFGWDDGIALGFTVATLGMIIGIVFGMVMIQCAFRRGYVREVRTFSERTPEERRGIHRLENRPSAGVQTVCCDSIDSLAWHIALIGLSVLVGWGLHRLIPLKGFPLFPLCMVGGVLLQFAARLFRVNLLVDRSQMERISGAALDFLVVSAVATIRLDVVAANWLPLTILVAAGTVWSVWCVIFVSPRIFKTDWVERGIAEFGQASGVTATGLMLLRTVDPQNRTTAAIGFGYKQLLHEPFMGGGIWTALAFTLVYRIGWLNVFLISSVALLFWSVVAVFIARHNRMAR